LQEHAFAQLSPQEHLDKARALLGQIVRVGNHIFEPPQTSVDEAMKHLSAIAPSAPEFKKAQQLRQQYEAAQKKREEENSRLQTAAASKQAAQEAAQNSRKMYAQVVQRQLNDSGIDITVWVSDQQTDELVMDSDLFKDTENRVEFLQNILPRRRRDLCALKFRQVRLIRGGFLSIGDAYSVGCK